MAKTTDIHTVVLGWLTGGKNIADVLSAWNKLWLKLQTFIR
jgi:hypothetical protein